MNCPCQSGKGYDLCCGRFISHKTLAENAELLMRSRFTAFTLNNNDYILQTWHPDFRPANLQLEKNIKWIKLDILGFSEQDATAIVEFEARLLEAGCVNALHEESRFVRERGRWYYTSGEVMEPSFKPWKPGRNEYCPCGSGKKYKRCCGPCRVGHS